MQTSPLKKSKVETVTSNVLMDPRKLLDTEAEAFRDGDPMNCSTIYVIRKAHSKMAKLTRGRDVMLILSEKGMPSVVMICPMSLYKAWEVVRAMTEREVAALNKEFNTYGKGTNGWGHSFSPRETRSKVIAGSRFIQLVHCNVVESDEKNPGVIRFIFALDANGKVRKTKEYEIRPEPFLKETAALQALEALTVLRCGMLSSYLSRPYVSCNATS